MQSIVILTATYNHPKEILRLRESLINQTDKGFSWIIVDDGSGDETRRCLEGFQLSECMDVHVLSKANGGKSSAINYGLDALEENVRFVLIVDDDERLVPEAVTLLKGYVEKYSTSDCGVIHFNRVDEKCEVIANPKITEDFTMSYQRFKESSRYADGYLGYFTDQLGGERFSLYEGEKYCAPSTLFMKVTRHSKLLWASAILGSTEYLEGGITKQGRRLRLKNPRGMMDYCELMLEDAVGVKMRLVYSLQWYAYRCFYESPEKRPRPKSVFAVMFLPGWALASWWRKKYVSPTRT